MPMVLYMTSGNTWPLMHSRISVQMSLTCSQRSICSGYIESWCNLRCNWSNVFHGGRFVKSIWNVFSICGWFESVFFSTFSTSAWISLENISAERKIGNKNNVKRMLRLRQQQQTRANQTKSEKCCWKHHLTNKWRAVASARDCGN